LRKLGFRGIHPRRLLLEQDKSHNQTGGRFGVTGYRDSVLRNTPLTQRNIHIAIQVGLFLLVLCLYAYHCAPTAVVTSELVPRRPLNGDSLSIINQVEHRSTTYPTASPLWYILARLLRYLPLGEIPYRLNLMSALFGALSVLFLFRIVAGYRHDRFIEERDRFPHWFLSQDFPAIIVALFFAFSYPFWLLSECAAPDTLQVLMFLLVFYFLLQAFRTRVFSWFYYCAVALALGMGVYPVIVAVSPVIIIIIMVKTLEIKGRSGLPVLIAIYICGFLLHFYHPIVYALQRHGEYPQYGSFISICFAVVKRQVGFLRGMMGMNLLFWFPAACLPVPWLFVRRAEPGSLRPRLGFVHFAVNFALLFIGVFLMLNMDRRISDPTKLDLMMYGPSNPLPFLLISLWLGYLLGYVMHLSAGRKRFKGPFEKAKYGTRLVEKGLIVPAFLLPALVVLPVANVWMNMGPATPFIEIARGHIDPEPASGTGEQPGRRQAGELLRNWAQNKRICYSSLRGFREHERVGMELLQNAKEMRYEPDSSTFTADVLITNVPAFAELLQYSRGRTNMLYKHVVSVSHFRNDEWYYNRMLKHAFGIEPEASWETGRYDFPDAIYEAVLQHEGFVAVLVFSTRNMSLSERLRDGFPYVTFGWYSTRDPDALVDLAQLFVVSNEPEKVDNLLLLMLRTDPDNSLLEAQLSGRLGYYVRNREIEKARDLVRNAAKWKPDYKWLEYLLEGLIYRSMSPPEVDKAIQSFEKSIEMKPSVDACNEVATLFYQKKEYSEAYRYARQALELLDESAGDSQRSQVMDTLGWIAFTLVQAGDEDKSEESRTLLKQAYDLNKTDPYILMHYGALLYSGDDLADRNMGFSLLSRAKQMSPTLAREVDEIVTRIDRLRWGREDE
jgi:tetratricopeptide (TPR) repeat protein